MAEAFKITPQMLADLAKKVDSVSNDLDAAIRDMNTKVDAIEGQWVGAAKTAFDPLQEAAVQKAQGIRTALANISAAMGQNANTYDTTEQEVANAMKKQSSNIGSVLG
jgi:WXG100 family type VII secretion target